MVTHLVVFKPRPTLSAGERGLLIAAFDQAVQSIPSVRGVRVGQRLRHGAAYEQDAPDVADFLVAIDFDDLRGLEEYLQHPAHRELGTRFNASIGAALIYDFTSAPLDALR
jgi:hypothetical protein